MNTKFIVTYLEDVEEDPYNHKVVVYPKLFSTFEEAEGVSLILTKKRREQIAVHRITSTVDEVPFLHGDRD